MALGKSLADWKSAVNPDNGSGCSVRAKRVPVASYTEASRVAREFIEAHDLGGGSWTGGQVFDATGAQVARVSYNGRVWAMDGSEVLS